jgi:hypothetical protein
MQYHDPNSPARNERIWREKYEAITLCGKNRGPHDFIPTLWKTKPVRDKDNIMTDETIETVMELMCRVCFTRVSIETLLKNFPKADL